MVHSHFASASAHSIGCGHNLLRIWNFMRWTIAISQNEAICVTPPENEKSSTGYRVCGSSWFPLFPRVRSIPTGEKKNWNILDRITGGAVSRVCWVKARREFAEMKWQSNKPKAIAAISLCSANAAPRWRWRWQCFARNCSGSSSAHTIFSYVK